MWEVKFHKTNSNHLFTCSEDGAVWHWDASLVGSSHMVQTQFTGTGMCFYDDVEMEFLERKHLILNHLIREVSVRASHSKERGGGVEWTYKFVNCLLILRLQKHFLTRLLCLAGAGSGGANFSLNPSFQFGGSENVNKWLCSDNKKMEINSLIDDNILPVNSVDIESQTLICGTDSESLITIRLPTLR